MTDQDLIDFADTYNSLTGYDEDAIIECFGTSIDALRTEETAIKGLRAMKFVTLLHQGTSKRDAYKAVQAIGRGELTGMFVTDAPEIELDEPTTESGKDDSLDATPPSDLPTSVSPTESNPANTGA